MPSIDPTVFISPDETVALSLRGQQLVVLDIASELERTFDLPAPGRLIAGRAGMFAVIGQGEPVTVTVRAFERPDEIVASGQLDGSHLAGLNGEVVAGLPPLIVIGPDVALVREMRGYEVRRLGSSLPESLTDLEGVPYAAAAPDDRHVLVCSYRFGREMVTWDVGSGRVAARIELTGMGVGCGTFRPGRAELWIAQADTIERIDTAASQIIDARRVRNQPTGSFVHAMAFDGDGRSLAVGHSLRHPQPLPGTEWPWFAPSGGQLLVLDADEFRVTHRVEVDHWLDGLAWLSDGRVVAHEWGETGSLRIITPSPGSYELHEPRRPGEWNWL